MQEDTSTLLRRVLRRVLFRVFCIHRGRVLRRCLARAFRGGKAWWPKSRDASAMCDATRISRPQIASDVKNFFSLAMREPLQLL